MKNLKNILLVSTLSLLLFSCAHYGMIADNDVYLQKSTALSLDGDADDPTSFNNYKAGREGRFINGNSIRNSRFALRTGVHGSFMGGGYNPHNDPFMHSNGFGYDPFYRPHFHPYNNFGYSSFYSPFHGQGFNSGFGHNNFGYNNFGYNNFGYNNFGYNNFGYNNFGYNNFGYNNFGNGNYGHPYGGYGYGYGYNSFGGNYGYGNYYNNTGGFFAGNNNFGSSGQTGLVYRGHRSSLNSSSARSSAYPSTMKSTGSAGVNSIAPRRSDNYNNIPSQGKTNNSTRGEVVNRRTVDTREYARPAALAQDARNVTPVGEARNVNSSSNRDMNNSFGRTNNASGANAYRPSETARNSGVSTSAYDRRVSSSAFGNSSRTNSLGSSSGTRGSYGTSSSNRGRSYGTSSNSSRGTVSTPSNNSSRGSFGSSPSGGSRGSGFSSGGSSRSSGSGGGSRSSGSSGSSSGGGRR